MSHCLDGCWHVVSLLFQGIIFDSKTRCIRLMPLLLICVLEMFPWADFRTTKGAVKIHVGLNHAGYLPEFVTVTEGKNMM